MLGADCVLLLTIPCSCLRDKQNCCWTTCLQHGQCSCSLQYRPFNFFFFLAKWISAYSATPGKRKLILWLEKAAHSDQSQGKRQYQCFCFLVNCVYWRIHSIKLPRALDKFVKVNKDYSSLMLENWPLDYFWAHFFQWLEQTLMHMMRNREHWTHTLLFQQINVFDCFS